MNKKFNVPVVVTTSHRGVFFGYANPKIPFDAPTIRIERARMCVHWSADVKGVVGLAATGPSNACRIGMEAPALTLRDVTGVFECSEKAVSAFGGAPWSK